MTNLLMAQTVRMIRRTGSAADSYEAATGRSLDASSYSRRIRQVDYRTIQRINDVVLQPKADPEHHPAAFWKGWRLAGIDGTTFTLQNTDQILAVLPKQSNASKKKTGPSKGAATGKAARGGEYGFPVINACALVELGTHAPLAAEIGLEKEGELTLAYRLIERVRPGMLLLADSLYGCGAFLQPLVHHCERAKAAFVMRVLPSQTSTTVRELGDGSRLVEVGIRSRKRPADIVEKIVVRELAYTVFSGDNAGKPVAKTCRLWTNLLDPVLYPALELATLITHRWEHEIFYGEAKGMLRHEYLESQLPETAVIEIMALLWASSLLAETRQTAAVAGCEATDVIRISFSKTYDTVEKLLWLLAAGRDVLAPEQTQTLVANAFDALRKHALKPRRSRKCPRKVRRQQTQWPKLHQRTEAKSEVTVAIDDTSIK